MYNESINQDPEHIIIAKYWAALPGPCVSISILSSVLATKNSNLSVAAEAYCKVGIATADALVSCYKTKYAYNQERPITFIRANFNPTWVSLIPTPPFPDYTSAHSVQTGAAARVLADIFGNNTTFTDNSINDLGFTPRTFTKFSDYANGSGSFTHLWRNTCPYFRFCGFRPGQSRRHAGKCATLSQKLKKLNS